MSGNNSEIIFLLEDTEVVRDALEAVLRLDGHTLPVVAASCMEAHESMDRIADAGVTVSILDHNLPDGHGYSIAEALRERHIGGRIIAHSSEHVDWGDEFVLKGDPLWIRNAVART